MSDAPSIATTLVHPEPKPKIRLEAFSGAHFVGKRALYAIVPTGVTQYSLVNISDSLYCITGRLAEIQQYLDDNQNRFQVPEKITFTVYMPDSVR